jgi:FkbM family methyltransferase
VKNLVKYVLQKTLGYSSYLYRFAKYKIRTLQKDKKEGDFFAFLDTIKGSGLLLDVGANIGVMTYHMSKQFPKNQILAIEPIPTNFGVLGRITNEFNLHNVELIPEAVGNEIKEIEMVLPTQGKVKMQGLAHVVHDSIKGWNKGEKYTVKCNTLDELVKGEEVSAIKMDIENFEYFALLGAERILRNHHPVVYLELWENENREQCFELLEGHGYSTFVFIEDQLLEYKPEVHHKQNFIFKVV